jgi:photosystem II stability/assembly factor-like uncharacterized protein
LKNKTPHATKKRRAFFRRFFCTFLIANTTPIVMKKIVLLLIVFGLMNTLSAQKFISGDSAHSFVAVQKQFDQWKQQQDLNQVKGWKYFKHWEYEMQYHTGADGEPADATDYLTAASNLANEKQNQSNTRSMMTNAWYPVGPDVVPNNLTGYMQNGIGRINCMAFHPTNSNVYYVGVAQGGVWKTTNNGVSWTPITDNLPILRISDITLDPNDPDNTIYISVCDFEYIGFGLFLNGRKRHTHYGLGVYKTTNGGTSWNATGLTFQLTDYDASLIREIIIDPSNSNNILACGTTGMYRSTDAGTSWTMVQAALFWDMVQDPVSPNTIYAATGWVLNSNSGAAGIYKSTNFGQSWTLLNTGIPATGQVQRVKLALAPSDPNYIYAFAVDLANGLYGIYKTTNAGSSWTYSNPSVNILESGDGSNGGGQGNYDFGAVVHPTNRNIVYTGGINIWATTDGGATFNPVSHWTLYYGPTVHGDLHYFAIQPSTGNFFVCGDGGIARTSSVITQTWNDANNGNPWPTQWTDLGFGMQVTSFYRLSSSRNSTGRLIAGAQDNASFYFESGNWFTVYGGDGMDNYLDPLDDNGIFCSSQYGNWAYSNDDGNSFFGLSANVNNELGEWVSPIVADYNNPGTIYIGFENVVKTSDNGNSWNAISSFPFMGGSQEISVMAVANSNANVLYVAKRVRYENNLPGIFYKTTNGGGTWTNVTAGLPDSLYCTGIEISETDANTVYVCLAGFSTGNKVFKTTDGGTTWQNISFNLPNIPVNCVKYVPSANKIMIATDLGVYVLDESTSTWSNQSTGLPNVIVSDIEFNIPLNKIYVSTFGRGIWATDLDVFTANIQQPQTSNQLEISLYPSPNNGSFTITSTDAQPLNLEVLDIRGRVVYSEQLTGKTQYQFQLNVLPGMYYAHVRGDKSSGVKSFVVE